MEKLVLDFQFSSERLNQPRKAKKILMLRKLANYLIILNLTEFEAKQVFTRYGIPIPKGRVISEAKHVASVVGDLKPPYMVKAQVTVGGRGKAGGVLSAASAQEAEEAAGRLLGSSLKGMRVTQVLIEEKLAVRKELYIGFTVDRTNRCYVALASAAGGMDIEEVAENQPKTIIRAAVDPQLTVDTFNALPQAKLLGYGSDKLLELSSIIQILYRVLVENDAETVEINPLIETEDGSFVAADARIVIDDNALYRHPEYAAEEAETLTPAEVSARKNNLAYVKLQGDVGVVGNGAGLVMSTLDLIDIFGGRAADFLDVGGGASIEAIKAAVEIVLADTQVKAVLVNVLGGITRCDEVARGIVGALEESGVKKPFIVRLVGTNQREGEKILGDAGISVLSTMEEAAKQAVEIAGEKR